MKTCEECFHKCKAQCCTWVPIPIKFLEKHKDKIQRKILTFYPANKSKTTVYPIVEISGYKDNKPIILRPKQRCIFLDNNNRCAIYENRLEICKLYGTTSEPDNSLTCGFHIGKDFSFPEENHPDYKEIKKADESGKYHKYYMNNLKLLQEMFGI